jgi:hypothetical protein
LRWGNVGEPPVLLLRGWESQLGKPDYPRFAQGKHPRRRFGSSFKPLKLLEVLVRLLCLSYFGCLNHIQNLDSDRPGVKSEAYSPTTQQEAQGTPEMTPPKGGNLVHLDPVDGTGWMIHR